jgi:hypothetical protein
MTYNPPTYIISTKFAVCCIPAPIWFLFCKGRTDYCRKRDISLQVGAPTSHSQSWVKLSFRFRFTSFDNILTFFIVNYVIAKVLNITFTTPTSAGLKVAFIITDVSLSLKINLLNTQNWTLLYNPTKILRTVSQWSADYLLLKFRSRPLETRPVLPAVFKRVCSA